MTEASGSGRGKLIAVRLGLGLASAALIGSYAWYPSLALLPYVALVPWIVLYTDERTPRASLGWFVLTSWIAVMLEYPQPFRLVPGRSTGQFIPPTSMYARFVSPSQVRSSR